MSKAREIEKAIKNFISEYEQLEEDFQVFNDGICPSETTKTVIDGLSKINFEKRYASLKEMSTEIFTLLEKHRLLLYKHNSINFAKQYIDNIKHYLWDIMGDFGSIVRLCESHRKDEISENKIFFDDTDEARKSKAKLSFYDYRRLYRLETVAKIHKESFDWEGCIDNCFSLFDGTSQSDNTKQSGSQPQNAESKDNGQVTLKKSNFGKEDSNYMRLLEDLHGKLPGERVTLDKDRHGNFDNVVKSLNTALEKPYSELVGKFHKKGKTVYCDISIKLEA
jgi:hypothetical protein